MGQVTRCSRRMLGRLPCPALPRTHPKRSGSSPHLGLESVGRAVSAGAETAHRPGKSCSSQHGDCFVSVWILIKILMARDIDVEPEVGFRL